MNIALAYLNSLNARKFKNAKERAKLSQDKPETVRRELLIEFPLESTVELPCHVQPGKWSTASEQRRISICQRQKRWLT